MCPSAATVRRTEKGFWIRQGSLQERRQHYLDGIARKSALLKQVVHADHRGELVGGITKMERVASEAGKECWMCQTKSCFQRVRLCAKRVRLLGSAAAERATSWPGASPRLNGGFAGCSSKDGLVFMEGLESTADSGRQGTR